MERLSLHQSGISMILEARAIQGILNKATNEHKISQAQSNSSNVVVWNFPKRTELHWDSDAATNYDIIPMIRTTNVQGYHWNRWILWSTHSDVYDKFHRGIFLFEQRYNWSLKPQRNVIATAWIYWISKTQDDWILLGAIFTGFLWSKSQKSYKKVDTN